MKYNILYVDTASEIYGGGQISLLELLKEIDRNKYTPQVILSGTVKLKEKMEGLSLNCTMVPMPKIKLVKIYPFLCAIWKLYKFTKKEKISVIHTNTSRAMIYAAFVGLIVKIPIIWHVRIPDSDGLLDRILASRANIIITVSQAVKERFGWIKKDKVRVIYNGVNTVLFSRGPATEKAKKKIGITSTTFVIGTVGRLSPEKGLEFIISGMVDIVKAYPNTKLIIVGHGNDEYKLTLQEKIERLGLSSNIFFVGFYDDITPILRCFDIYCLSSLTEGFNRTLLEAMAVGLPVVATAVGGNVEIVEDSVNGILVPPSDSRALTTAIKDLLKDKKRSDKMGQMGRRIILDKFGIKENVQLTQSIYEEMISRK